MEKDKAVISPPNHEEMTSFERFSLSQRVEHFVMLVSFTMLALTGLPQKFPESATSVGIIRSFGGIESTRHIHHINAVILMVVSIFHLIAVLYRTIVLRKPIHMLPVIQDFKHLFLDVTYYLGLRKHKSVYGRYNYAEKAEYFAVVWGTVVMAITGFMMWNPIAAARFLPGQAIPAAKAAHGGEAILAVLAILIWHFYHVHVRTFNKSMFTGKLSHEQMEEEHPAELQMIVAGKGWNPPSAELLRRRQRIFLPVSIILSGLMTLGLVAFLTIEETAITTIPQGETSEIFAPLTPTARPTLIPSPTVLLSEGVQENSWDGMFEAMFRNRCSTCHGFTSVGGLSLATYQQAIEGGESGPAIVPGDPDASTLIQVQLMGEHPGQLTIDEIEAVINWISAGAPEN